MDKKRFEQLAAEGYTLIPVFRETAADLDTPLSAYLKLANRPFSYLFESVQGGEKWGRYSIIGLPCRKRLLVRGRHVVVSGDDGEQVHETDNPLDWIEDYQKTFNVPKVAGMPRFSGGLVGCFGYDSIRYMEKKMDHHANAVVVDTPDVMLMVSEDVVIFDNLKSRVQVITHAALDGERDAAAVTAAWEKAQQRLAQMIADLRKPLAYEQAGFCGTGTMVEESDFKSMYDAAAYGRGVEKIKSYIRAGDVMQVVLSQCMSVPFDADPLNLYRALRSSNPSPYMYYLHMGDFHIVGSSPEILVRLEDGLVTVRPIAGTRPRGGDEQSDQALEAELLSDPKELAEHLMLIDLGRNDVGRIAEVGSVQLTEKMLVERYSHVMHIVSNVTGRLRPGLSAMDVLRASFPAGTVSGAPKIRAMEIIDELEPTKRGVYAGAIGYLGWSGNMDTAIAIRTAVIKDGVLYIQAGAGIVADSIPENEWEETMNKGRAIFHAVRNAQRGIE